ncbi:hypothetical protein [Kribbella sp. VKM Ac-2568]|uniref:hypothetical protein n=1 Tax=Kribbella sp. VKM Ac-2568 TaxID=2512219 RepID=UPI0010512A70|nr:hypothetical protein [Kribbella sp. VKM Ac-2568]TCM48285.1 hypothetical protein EV648_104681 [Kribbella sp. VKM Ac-2568]
MADGAGSAEERHASWLELFFDLTGVAAAALSAARALLAWVILGWFSTYDRLVERARRPEPAMV